MSLPRWVQLATKRRSYALLAILLISVTSVTSWYHEPNVPFSTPEECLRPCRAGEPPKICYWEFHIEYYTTLGPACDVNRTLNSPTTAYGNECILADGVEKTVVSINRQIPGPLIEVCQNDIIVVDVNNEASGMSDTIHWHGIWQTGSQYYDGVPFITQCPIHGENIFRYQFGAYNPGTHFYHSHVSTHMIDGTYGGLIVRRADDPHRRLYDFDLPEHVVVMSDLFHNLSEEHYPGRYRTMKGQTAQNFAINGQGTWTDPATNKTTNVPLATFTVKPGKRYRFRLINSFSTVCPSSFSIEDHKLQVIAQDGENIRATSVYDIVSTTGERYDFVVTAHNSSSRSYWIHLRGLGECEENRIFQTAILRYEGAPEQPSTAKPQYDFSPPGKLTLDPLNVSDCYANPKVGVCPDQLKSVEVGDRREENAFPDVLIVLGFNFHTYQTRDFRQGAFMRYFVAPDATILDSLVSNISFGSPPGPPISQAEGYEKLCNPTHLPNDCTTPCTCTHTYHIPLHSRVHVLTYDEAQLKDLHHPFHLHGYAFKVFEVGQYSDGRNITRNDVETILNEHRIKLQNGEYSSLPGKDTIKIPQGGYAIIGFTADNPGWWLYHCHFSWHTATGMDVVFHVGGPQDLPPVPPGFPMCRNFQPDVKYESYLLGYY